MSDALHSWLARQARQRHDLVRLGVFGSFARGDWGVGSDLDLIAIVRSSPDRFDRRAVSWDLTSLPVSADLVIYTEDEWETLRRGGARMVETVEREGLWLHPRPNSATSVP